LAAWTNLWLMHEGLAFSLKNFTLIALWDGVKTEGLGGSSHMRGARIWGSPGHGIYIYIYIPALSL
jgi:hypothetical protein